MVRMPRPGRRVLLISGGVLIVLLGAGSFVAHRAANASAPLEGNRVTAGDLRILARAATACPALTPPRLAGQVMVASNFGNTPVAEMSAGGAAGVAALTPDQWTRLAPWPGAQLSDREAAVTGLAHGMCQLVGQARSMGLKDDPWKIALAGHRLGMDKVIAAGDIPGEARDYVSTVDRYAAWYALQPSFGAGSASPSAGPAPAGGLVPVPDPYVKLVVAAGKTCREVPPALIAAQLMVTSGFDPDRLGPAGEQGIAQFRPQVWRSAKAGGTPWDPAAAIPALGRTMCTLVQGAGSQYAPALAAFTRGDQAAQVTTLAEAVTKAQNEYVKDTRLQNASKPSGSAPPLAAAPGSATSATTQTKKPVKGSTPGRSNQPAVKAADLKGRSSFGPYFVVNLATKQCVDLAGHVAAERDGPVNQFPCAKDVEDNQEWRFVPRGTGSGGYQLYWIQNIDSEFCIDPPGTGGVSSSTPLSQTGCFEQDNQLFRLEPKVTAGGWKYYWIRNVASNMCVDVDGPGNGGNDARLTLVPCMSGDDHEWALVQGSEW